jgi:hypothetical protein
MSSISCTEAGCTRRTTRRDWLGRRDTLDGLAAASQSDRGAGDAGRPASGLPAGRGRASQMLDLHWLMNKRLTICFENEAPSSQKTGRPDPHNQRVARLTK